MRRAPFWQCLAVLIVVLPLSGQDSALPDRWRTLSTDARTAYMQKDYARAEKLYLLAIEEAGGIDQANVKVAENLHYLGILYSVQKRRDEAIAAFNRRLAVYEQLYGATSLEVVQAILTVGNSLDQAGSRSEAEPFFRRALDIGETHLGTEGRLVAQVLQSLARCLNMQRKYGEAEAAAKRALTIREKQVGPHHQSIIQPLFLLAGIYSNQAKVAEAELAYFRCIELAKGTVETKMLVFYCDTLALLYRRYGRYAESEHLYKLSIEAAEREYGPESEVLLAPLQAYWILLRQMGRAGDAAAVWARVEKLRSTSVKAPAPPQP